MNKTQGKMSQIILYVDNYKLRDAVCAFCTKGKELVPEIWFTYNDFDMEKLDENELMLSIEADICVSNNEVFVISNNPCICKCAKKMNIAYAALVSDDDMQRDYSDIFYLIEDIENISVDTIDRMWKRFKGIPWTIAVTDRLIIREQTLEDIQQVYEIYNNPEAVEYVDCPKENVDEETEYMRLYINYQYRFFEFGIWVVEEKESGKVIGRAGIETRDDLDGIEVGYIIGKEYRRKGYAKEALTAIIDYVAEEFDTDRLRAFTRHDNTASVLLLKQKGFEYVGDYDISGYKHEEYMLKLV